MLFWTYVQIPLIDDRVFRLFILMTIFVCHLNDLFVIFLTYPCTWSSMYLCFHPLVMAPLFHMCEICGLTCYSCFMYIPSFGVVCIYVLGIMILSYCFTFICVDSQFGLYVCNSYFDLLLYTMSCTSFYIFIYDVLVIILSMILYCCMFEYVMFYSLYLLRLHSFCYRSSFFWSCKRGRSEIDSWVLPQSFYLCSLMMLTDGSFSVLYRRRYWLL